MNDFEEKNEKLEVVKESVDSEIKKETQGLNEDSFKSKKYGNLLNDLAFIGLVIIGFIMENIWIIFISFMLFFITSQRFRDESMPALKGCLKVLLYVVLIGVIAFGVCTFVLFVSI